MSNPKAPLSFSQQLKQARLQRGWSQARLASELGTDNKTVSRWERGVVTPAPYLREKLEALFGISPQALGLVEFALPEDTTLSSSFLFDPAIPLLPAISLVGRDAQIQHLRHRLRSGGNVSLSALNGLPGVGKTALSIALAYDPELQAHFRDGILWAGLGPEPNILGHLSRWGTLLGLSSSEMERLTSRDAWAVALHRVIGSRRMLLIIDDAWQSEDAVQIKIGGPNCAHLITTRFPSIATLVAADGATVINELTPEEGWVLLQKLAPQAVAQEPQKVHQLVELMGGLPLALILAGNYLRIQSSSGSARRIAAALQRLVSGDARLDRLDLQEPRSPAERHATRPNAGSISLRSIIAVSDQQFDAPARAAFYALAVFPAKPNTFSEEAALAIASCPVETFDQLVDTGLVQGSGGGRYTLHQTISDYAHVQLAQDGAAQEATLQRLITYLIHFVEEHATDYERLERESTTILATLAQTEGTDLIRMAYALTSFLLARGFYDLAETHLKRAYNTSVATKSTVWRMRILTSLGEIVQRSSLFAQAEAYFQDALGLARQLGDDDQTIYLLSLLGTVGWKQGKYEQAEAHSREGMRIAKAKNSPRLYHVFEILGTIENRRGRLFQAEQYMREGIELFRRQPKDEAQLSVMMDSLGGVLASAGKFEEAEKLFEEALALEQKTGHLEWMCATLNNLGDMKKQLGDYHQAEGYLHKGLELARNLGVREWICVLAESCGELARRRGQRQEAGAYLEEAQQLARELPIPVMQALTDYEFGCLALQEKDIARAEKHFQEMQANTPPGDGVLIPLRTFAAAQLAAVRGNKNEALRLAGN